MFRTYLRFVNAVAERRRHEVIIRTALYCLPVVALGMVVIMLWQWHLLLEALVVVGFVSIVLVGLQLRSGFHIPQIFSRQDVYEDETLYLDEDGIPVPYDCLPHIKRFWKRAAPGFTVSILGVLMPLLALVQIAEGTVAVIFVLAGPILAVVGLYMTAREYFRYKQEPIHCEPEDGLVSVYQANSIKWLLRGSDPDPYSADDFVFYTPQKTIMEWLIFKNSQTLQIKASPDPQARVLLTLKDVRNVKHLLAIQRYRQALQAQEVEQAKSMVDLLESQGNQLGALIELVRDIVRRMGGDPETLELPNLQ